MKRFFVVLIFGLISISSALADEYLTHKGWSLSLSGGPNIVYNGTGDVSLFIKDNKYPYFDVRVGRSLAPEDKSDFAGEYNYPTVGIGVSFNNLRSMGFSGPSHLNNIVDLYGFFERDIIKYRRFAFGYELVLGFGFNSTRYDPITNPYNDIFNSAIVFDIGFGPTLKWRPLDNMEIGACAKFRHHSVGKLAFPNSGLNELVPSLSMRYYFEEPVLSETPVKRKARNWEKGFEWDMAAGCGVQRCVSEWEVYNRREEDPQKKVATIQPYPKFFASAGARYRYAARFSSGLSFDVFCSTQEYIEAQKRCDAAIYGEKAVREHSYSPFSCGISAVQEFHYGGFSIRGQVGIFLFERHGLDESVDFSYQKIGLRYNFKSISGLSLSMACKTYYFTQAETMEFGIGVKL